MSVALTPLCRVESVLKEILEVHLCIHHPVLQPLFLASFRPLFQRGKLRRVMFVGLPTTPTSAALGAAIITQHPLPSAY